MPRHDSDPHTPYRLAFGYRLTSVQTDAWRPALEVYETARAFVVRAELAGIDPDNLIVSLDGEMLTVQGERKPGTQGTGDGPERRSYHEMGIPYGAFRARVSIPFAVARDEIEAHYEHGFLTVVLPRAQRVRIHAQESAQPATVGAEDGKTTSGEAGKDSE